MYGPHVISIGMVSPMSVTGSRCGPVISLTQTDRQTDSQSGSKGWS